MAVDINALVMMSRANGQHLEADHIDQNPTGSADSGLAGELASELRSYVTPPRPTAALRGRLTGDQAMLGSTTGKNGGDNPPGSNLASPG